ncbi:MAG: hypothetical protein ABIT04_01130 [Novosphingobium sp.]
MTAEAEARPERRGSLRPYADPAAVIAAEIAFNQLAQAKGQWTAFRATSARDAVMFVPERVDARQWLKGRPDPPVAARWQPHEVWVSCDGSYAVTRGGWRKPDSTGVFVTVWQRQEKTRGYRWVLDIGDTLAQPLAAPEMIAGRVAECAGRPARPGVAPAQAPDEWTHGRSDDGTLRWAAEYDGSGTRVFNVQRWTGAAFEESLHVEFAPRR